MTSFLRPALVLGLVLLAASQSGCSSNAQRTAPAEQEVAPTSAQQMTRAAQALLASLSPEQRTPAQFELDADTVRTNWSNLPAMFVERDGVRVGDLSDSQRRLLHDLLRTSTSSQGYQKIAGVIRLDEILHETAAADVASGARRLPPGLVESWTAANYWFAFFGDPGTDASWAWQITGHHLGANFTVVGDRTGFTPLFLGAEPNEVMHGLEAGWKVLSHEAERGFELLQSMNEDQRNRAVLDADIPRDVLAGPGRKGSLSEFAGIPASYLTDLQRTLLWVLIEEYVFNADHDAAEAQLDEIRADGLDSLHFAWMGPIDDRSARYYYRVHGPSVLIEYVVEEGVGSAAANHVHSITRDPGNDYGEDWLGRHYDEHHAQ